MKKFFLAFIFIFISAFFIEEVKAEESINSVCVEKTTTIYEDNKWFETKIEGEDYDFTNLELKSFGNIEKKEVIMVLIIIHVFLILHLTRLKMQNYQRTLILLISMER